MKEGNSSNKDSNYIQWTENFKCLNQGFLNDKQKTQQSSLENGKTRLQYFELVNKGK